MARTDNDTWDLATSVGATATMVAAARALATRAPDPVIDDPFAEPLVRAVGVDLFTRLAAGEVDLATFDVDESTGMQRFADGMAARTRFFDEFLTAATAAGIRQVVILASGLDARAYRLSWPDGTVVFEIDQPEVIAFKSRTFAELNAEPTADRRTVAVDLRNDWPTALTEAGFDSSKPTAWIAEGLFGYLPPDAQDRLLDQITELSPAGSRVAAEGVPSIKDLDQPEIRERMQSMSDRWRAHGLDLNFSDLVFIGDRAEITSYLDGHGWATTAISTNQLLTDCGLAPIDDDAAGFAEVVYITASR